MVLLVGRVLGPEGPYTVITEREVGKIVPAEVNPRAKSLLEVVVIAFVLSATFLVRMVIVSAVANAVASKISRTSERMGIGSRLFCNPADLKHQD